MQPEVEWPNSEVELDLPEGDPEVKKTIVKSCTAVVEEKRQEMDVILQRFSSWYRLKKFVAWMLRLKKNLREASRSMTEVEEFQE